MQSAFLYYLVVGEVLKILKQMPLLSVVGCLSEVFLVISTRSARSHFPAMLWIHGQQTSCHHVVVHVVIIIPAYVVLTCIEIVVI